MRTIGVIGRSEVDDSIEVLSALAHSCGLRVERADSPGDLGVVGYIVVGPPSQHPEPLTIDNRPCIRVITSEVASGAAKTHFGTGPQVPAPFKGRLLACDCAVPPDQTEMGGEVVAIADGKPVWTTAFQGGLRHDTCWVPRPWIKKGDCVFNHLSVRRFMNLLPVLEWLRWVSDWRQWMQPELRACFMFDDPNLHSSRYGYVKFDQLASEGRAHNFHTAFATVPLDACYVNKRAARLVRDHSDTLSFLVHGNNHTYRELADRESGNQLALMRQAIQRTVQLERKAGLAVSRVMAPPHGVCSAEMMTAMVRAGFEAVCVSQGSVWTGNPGAKWTVSLGSLPVAVVSGLPVVPRFGLDHAPENGILLAAYLRQPIIMVGHHWDLVDGTGILSSAARSINALGDVTWCNMSAIAKGNYRSRLEGHRLRMQIFSRNFSVHVPEGVTELQLEASWADSQQETIEGLHLASASTKLSICQNEGRWHCGVLPGSVVNLTVVRKSSGAEQPIGMPRTPASAIVRRALVEVRDRAMPFLPRNFTRR